MRPEVRIALVAAIVVGCGRSPSGGGAPSATNSATAPVVLPESYVASFTVLQASVNQVTAAIVAAKDCNGVADAMNTFTNDPRTPKEIAAYFSQLPLLTPDQVKLATQQNGELTDKLTTIGIDRADCTKNPRMKEAMKAMSTMEQGAMSSTMFGASGGPSSGSLR
jgi:hypothetical protein